MRTTRLLLLPAIGLVAFALLAVAIFGSQASAAKLQGPPVLYQTPAPMRPAPGLIPPSGLGTESPSAITFSIQDVRTYVLAHGFIGGAIVPGHTLRILSIQLMTPPQADPQLETYTTTTMVYVVKMEGPFYTTNAALINPTTHNTTLTGYEIFDAHTGDTLEWGF